MQKHERAIKKLKDELALLLEEIKNMQARINQLEREMAIEEAEQVEQEKEPVVLKKSEELKVPKL